jgi:hypothetical protein
MPCVLTDNSPSVPPPLAMPRFPIPPSIRRCVAADRKWVEDGILTEGQVEMTNWEKGHYINYK